jgi:tetratricopeptide (TPR) repeat protein
VNRSAAPWRRFAARLERLGHEEKLEELSPRYRLPYAPAHEIESFRRIHLAELVAAKRALDGVAGASRDEHVLAWRGRINRLLGDEAGARADFEAALHSSPGFPLADAWLGELDLLTARGEERLKSAAGAGLDAARLYLGAGLLRRGEAPAAVEELEHYVRRRNRSCLGRLLLGRAEEQLGRRRAAIRSYARAGELCPQCSAGWVLAAAVENRGRRSFSRRALEAEPAYAITALWKFQPHRSWPRFLNGLWGWAVAQPGRLQASLDEEGYYAPHPSRDVARARRLAGAFPGDVWPRALVARGLLRTNSKDIHPEGLGLLEAAARRRPRAGWIQGWRGLGLLAAGRREEALDAFDLCLRLQPYYGRCYAWRGALLRKLGRTEEALNDLNAAVALIEGYGFAVHERSLARRAAGDFAGAAEDLEKAFRIDHRYTWVFTSGREPSASEIEDARKELDLAVERERGSASLRMWRGQLRWQTRRFEEGLSDLRQAVALDPRHVLAQGWLGRALAEAGECEAGADALRKAVQLDPGLVILRVWLARAEFAGGRRKKALSTLDAVIGASPRIWWVLMERARFHLELGSPARALEDIRTAIRYEGRHAECYFLAAQARLALADVKGAGRDVEKAIGLSPNLGSAYLLRAQINLRRGLAERTIADYRLIREKFPYLFNDEQKTRLESLLGRSLEATAP